MSLRKSIKKSRLWAILTRKVIIMLIPDSRKRSIYLQFRPIVPAMVLLFTAIFIVIGLWSFAQRGQDASTIAMLNQESQQIIGDNQEMHLQMQTLVQLLDQFQVTLSEFNETSNTSLNSNNESSGDLANMRVTSRLPEGVQLTDSQRLQYINQSITESLNPMKTAIKLLADQQELLSDMPTMWPVKNQRGHITMLFGPNFHPFARYWYLHRGLDIAHYPSGQPVISSANGKIISVKRDQRDYGTHVRIQHKYGIYTLYAHMQHAVVMVGQEVKQGDVIGYIGQTGNATGPHVHFEVRVGSQFVDPLKFLRMSSVNQPAIDSTFSNYTFGKTSHSMP